MSDRELKELLSRLTANDSEIVRNALDGVRRRVARPSVLDLWHGDEPSFSHWIYCFNGVSQESEAAVAKELLFWREFYAGPSARVRCVQSSERREYALCASHFGFSSTPVLLVSDVQDFKQLIQVESELLTQLQKNDGALMQFFNRLHIGLIRGELLSEIDSRLERDALWRKAGIVWKEVRGLISIKLPTG